MKYEYTYLRRNITGFADKEPTPEQFAELLTTWGADNWRVIHIDDRGAYLERAIEL